MQCNVNDILMLAISKGYLVDVFLNFKILNGFLIYFKFKTIALFMGVTEDDF